MPKMRIGLCYWVAVSKVDFINLKTGEIRFLKGEIISWETAKKNIVLDLDVKGIPAVHVNIMRCKLIRVRGVKH